MRHWLKKEKDFLIKFTPQMINFYRLPKLHKTQEIRIAVKTHKSEYIEIPNFSNLKFRSIVAGPHMLPQQIQ